MTNYENDIMEKLNGDTPKQKYDYLLNLKQFDKELTGGVEAEILTVCDKLAKTAAELFRVSGNESYTERCHLHDAMNLIYSLTNKSRIEKMSFIKWREAVQNKATL